MIHQIHLSAQVASPPIRLDLTDCARAALEHLNAAPGAMTLVLTDENALHQLNLRFAGIDRSTDVLSFPDGNLDPESGELYFGDVLIALPIAEQQALLAGHSLEAELAMLTVHGTLHLLGFDHLEEADYQQMRAAQRAILARFSITPGWPEG